MKNKQEIINFTILRLKNSLKGQARLVIDTKDSDISIEDKMLELEVIKDFFKYIEAYDKNKER